MAGFQKIADEHPEQLRAYVSMIDIAIVDFNDEERALRIWRSGMIALKTDEDRDSLTRMYRAIRSQLKPVGPQPEPPKLAVGPPRDPWTGGKPPTAFGVDEYAPHGRGGKRS